MLGICKLRNSIQTYAWGSRTGIADFLGRQPSGGPEAELWMGAHRKAPSEIEVDGEWVSLAEVIGDAPADILGAEAARSGAALPFLLKVLAAGRALSIQAHPDRRQAVAGCRREDAAGIPRDAPHRNYRDASAKPEILYALTPFAVLRGFRPPAEILVLMQRLGLMEGLPELARALRRGDLEAFFEGYMALDARRLGAVLQPALKAAERRAGEDGAFAWVGELERQVPGDRGVLAPLYLNLVELAPGEALFTGPGVLHAYLEGVGIELMASSDNVVRGGLTPKHVDVEELRAILRFEVQPPEVLEPVAAAGERRFATAAGELELAVIEVADGEVYERSGERGAEILLCGAGEGRIREATGGAPVPFVRGESFLVTAAVPGYRIEGSATLFRAAGRAARG